MTSMNASRGPGASGRPIDNSACAKPGRTSARSSNRCWNWTGALVAVECWPRFRAPGARKVRDVATQKTARGSKRPMA